MNGANKTFTERFYWEISPPASFYGLQPSALRAVAAADAKIGSLAARDAVPFIDRFDGNQIVEGVVERRARCAIEPVGQVDEEISGGQADVMQIDRQQYKLTTWTGCVESGYLYHHTYIISGGETIADEIITEASPRWLPFPLNKGQQITVSKYGDMVVRSIQVMPPDGRVSVIIAEHIS